MICEKCGAEKENKRTTRQNNALHLFFTLLAQELNAGGFDMRKVIRDEVDIPWNTYSVKEYLWRPIQETQLGKRSTTKLTTKEIDQIYDTLNRALAERTGVHVPFPSIEILEEQQVAVEINNKLN